MPTILCCHVRDIILNQPEANQSFLSFHTILSFPGGSAGKESARNAGGPSSIPGSGRSPGEWIDYPLQYSGLENSMDCIVRGITESDTTEQLSWASGEIFKTQIRNALKVNTSNI